SGHVDIAAFYHQEEALARALQQIHRFSRHRRKRGLCPIVPVDLQDHVFIRKNAHHRNSQSPLELLLRQNDLVPFVPPFLQEIATVLTASTLLCRDEMRSPATKDNVYRL